jgi:hypothetical protein
VTRPLVSPIHTVVLCRVGCDLHVCFVQGPTGTPCKVGVGVAACAELGLLVLSNDDHTLSVHGLAPGLPLLYTFGSRGAGPCQFRSPMHLCFTPWGGNTLLVAEHEGGRVQEVNVEEQSHVKHWFVGQLIGPRGVAASVAHIAVSEGKAATHRVSLFCKAADTWLWRIGGTFHTPSGLRLSLNGGAVMVADEDSSSVSWFGIAGGSFIEQSSAELSSAEDVEELDSGCVLVVGYSRLVKLQPLRSGFAGGAAHEGVGAGAGVGPGELPASCSPVTLMTEGTEEGQISSPVAIARIPGTPSSVIIREYGTRQLQAVNVGQLEQVGLCNLNHNPFCILHVDHVTDCVC